MSKTRKLKKRKISTNFLNACREKAFVAKEITEEDVYKMSIVQMAIALGKPDGGKGGDHAAKVWMSNYYSIPIESSHPKLLQKVRKPIAINVYSKVDPNSDDFLSSYEWRVIRMQALVLHGAKCQCCGISPKEGAIMNVDHIKPRRKYPELALVLDNLQVLCGACNHGKSNWDETDWRITDDT